MGIIIKQLGIKTLSVRDFILQNVADHPKDIARLTATTLGISRVAVTLHLQALIREGLLEATGKTKSRKYVLKLLIEENFEFQRERLEEHVVWQEKILPLLSDIPQNVLGICEHGFTEMVNNAIDHSGSEKVFIQVYRNAAHVGFQIRDRGVGIFKHIAERCHLSSSRQAILELSKGKLTTDAAHHSGEGIFFTSRMFDTFAIGSDTLKFIHWRELDDWLIEDEEQPIEGTEVHLSISNMATHTAKEVFDTYRAEFDEFGFSKTHIPVMLLKYEGENLISRSQAKRLLSRADQFKEVTLDFKDVATIGQPFADEVFRVYRTKNPEVHMEIVNTSEDVKRMISRVLQGQPIPPLWTALATLKNKKSKKPKPS